MAKTLKIGNKGEAYIQSLIEGAGFNILKRWGKTSEWDCLAECPTTKVQKTFEGKSQPDYLTYGGFSVEVGNKRLGNYMFQPKDFTWEGSPCVYTGLAVSTADFYVFTNGRNIAYFVPTKALIEWFERVKTEETHRIKFGGYDGRSLQAQIRIEELEKISLVVDTKKKRGRKKIGA
jgi:hypothetical protein